METVGSRQARTHLAEFLERVAHGEEFTIIEQGKPVDRLVPAPHPVSKSDVKRAIEELKGFRNRPEIISRFFVHNETMSGRDKAQRAPEQDASNLR